MKTANWPSLSVLSGAFGLVFVSICYVILVLFRRFGVFFELDFALIAFDKKGNTVVMQTGLRFSGRAKTVHHRKARV